MVPEVPLAILAAALRVALASRPALVGIDLEANLRAQRQHQNIAGPVALPPQVPAQHLSLAAQATGHSGVSGSGMGSGFCMCPTKNEMRTSASDRR